MTDASTPPSTAQGHVLDAMLALQPREPGSYDGHSHPATGTWWGPMAAPRPR